MMYKININGFLFICLCCNVFSQAPTIDIDGKIGDWTTFNFAKGVDGTCYHAKADSSYMYIGFVTMDKKLIGSVLLHGMRVKIKENDRLSVKEITYPLGFFLVGDHSSLNTSHAIELERHMAIKGLIQDEPSIINIGNRAFGIEACYNVFDFKVMVIEIKIPLRYIVFDSTAWEKIQLKFLFLHDSSKNMRITKVNNPLWYNYLDAQDGRRKKYRIKTKLYHPLSIQ